MLTSLIFVVKYWNYCPVLGLDEWVSLWDDNPVFDVLNLYAQMQSFKARRVIFWPIHFCVFYSENASPHIQTMDYHIPLNIFQLNKSRYLLSSGCCICVTVMLARPTHPSIMVQILHPALRVKIIASQGSLDIRDLHFFAHPNLNWLRNRLLSTIL